ncbi:MAG: CHASE domain-containing protein [Proteobacteria bacterium]|nr:CHASE domain-containing protein [Pseudomonadota bacterium]
MEKRLEKRALRRTWFLRYPRGLPLALLIFGLAVTVLIMRNIEQSEARERRLELDRDTTAFIGELQRKAAENIAYLNAAASLLSVSEQVSPQEFGRFVEDLSQNHLARGALGMGWARWMKARDCAAYQARWRTMPATGALTVKPVPANPNADVAVIELLEPQDAANRRVLGFNMYSEKVRRAVIDKALRTGRPTVSGIVHLIQDEGKPPNPGVLVVVPVYTRTANGAPSVARPKGFAYSPLRLQDFVSTIGQGFHHGRASIALYDGQVSQANLLATIVPEEASNDGQIKRQMAFADRNWTLVVTSNEQDGLTLASVVVLIGGSIVSLLLLALTSLFIRRAADDRLILESFATQEAIRRSLTRELNHRVKNTLANVLSIVALTRRRSGSLDAFADSLTGRIRALSATHDLLSERDWKDAPVRDVVKSELAPYLDPDDSHAEIDGPDAMLAPRDALSLGLALHELATNAAKYGALSTVEGRVSVAWHLISPAACQIKWRECGGPPVQPPQHRGFGTDLIEKIVSHELQSPVDLRFDPSGVTCVLTVPVCDAAPPVPGMTSG